MRHNISTDRASIIAQMRDLSSTRVADLTQHGLAHIFEGFRDQLSADLIESYGPQLATDGAKPGDVAETFAARCLNESVHQHITLLQWAALAWCRCELLHVVPTTLHIPKENESLMFRSTHVPKTGSSP